MYTMDDRTKFVPSHFDRNTLPCTPLFSRLLRLASRLPPKPVIRDVRANLERDNLQLLNDVLSLRETLYQILPVEKVKAIHAGQDTYIAVLAPGGYCYVVAVLAILALGAAAVPLTTALPVEEAVYFIKRSGSLMMLTCDKNLDLGKRLQQSIRSSFDHEFCCIPIEPSLGSEDVPLDQIVISSNRYLDENDPGLVIFTSGTTGPPKGAVMRRAYTFDGALSVADIFGLKEDDVMLHVLPVHHATGVGITLFPFLITGCCIEFRSGGFDETWMWERWREGAKDPSKRITFFSGVPTIYMRMRRLFQQKLSKLPRSIVEEYLAGARQFRTAICGSSALPYPISDFWTQVMGKKILQRYGATEFGAVIKAHPGDENVPDGSVGEKVAGIDLKLSEGDEGEILVKSPYMFAKYLGDAEATKNAHDEQGYFKTGDIARRCGKYYFIVGRASIDIIKSGGYKISALDIEREILALPYALEVIVVGVPDDEYGQKVGAILTLQHDSLGSVNDPAWSKMTIDKLRSDLKERLAGYKMPTLLRVVEGELPKTPSGKVVKKVLGPKYFPSDYYSQKEVQIWQPISSIKAKL
ncbi:fatty-acyl-CoA synthase [Microthyrium microscopicum]|uniref:Fatty-acyl-CoA synthase n=1 Tax=Microthyrium microscopicum TaxID=703497 RepID=A0A6A6U781_9PEZI|nr:fatty-acyl-CoA synthase [Microthyrium microscopicum]